MNEHLQTTVTALKERFAAGMYEFRDEVSLIIKPEQVVEFFTLLRNEYGFELLNELTAVDYWPEDEPRFHVVYRVRSYQHNTMIGVRVPLNGNSPTLPSITSIYLGANWFEREVYDMFGIQLEGHPDPRRIVMPEDWEGHPLRKDYPLGYEEVQFTFNFDEVMERKPRPKD